MWTTIGGAALKFGSAVLSFFGDAFRYVGLFVAYRLGIRKERQKQVEKRLEQDNAAARLQRDVALDDSFRKRLRDKFVKR